MAAPLGDDRLADIPRRIIVEMRRRSYQLAAPVLLPHSGVAPWRELQVPVCPEMDERIGHETFLHIQVRSQVAVWRRHFHTMHELEVIVAQRRTWLREQQHVAIPQAGHGDAVAVGEEAAGSLSVTCCHLGIFLRCKHLLGPFLILGH